MCKAVAVYGTLRYGGPMNGLMRGFKYLGRDTIYGRLYNLGRFPALDVGSEKYPDEQVVVDVYEIPKGGDRLIEGLDKYEGYFPQAPDQSLFTRQKVLTVEGNMEVWVYEYNYTYPHDARIKSGDWFDVVF